VKASRFTEAQIIGILREQEAGAKKEDVCAGTGSTARPSTSGRPMAAWRFRARRPKELEDENAKLKKLLAEAMLDNARLKEISSRCPSWFSRRTAFATSPLPAHLRLQERLADKVVTNSSVTLVVNAGHGKHLPC